MCTNVSITIIFAGNMHIDSFESSKKIFPFGSVDAHCVHPEQPRLVVDHFEIFKDESKILEQGRNDVLCASQPERRVNEFTIFKDETEVLRQVQNGSGSVLDPAQCKLESAWILAGNSRAPDKERRDNEIHEPTKVRDENCPPNYFIDDNSPDVGAGGLCGSEIQTCNCEKSLHPQSVPCSHIKISDTPVPPGM
jgi:hypothetical protein